MTDPADQLRAALEVLLADVESIAGTPNAYGMPLEDPNHPFHDSVAAARKALARTAKAAPR